MLVSLRGQRVKAFWFFLSFLISHAPCELVDCDVPLVLQQKIEICPCSTCASLDVPTETFYIFLEDLPCFYIDIMKQFSLISMCTQGDNQRLKEKTINIRQKVGTG